MVKPPRKVLAYILPRLQSKTDRKATGGLLVVVEDTLEGAVAKNSREKFKVA